MGRSRLVKFLVVVVVVVTATFSSVRAGQIWAETQAQSRAQTARAGAVAALDQASTADVQSPQLALYRGALAELDRSPTPDSSPLWGSGDSTFYNRQARSYSALAVRVRELTSAVTRATRLEARASLKRLETGLDTARTLNVDRTAALSVLRRERASFLTATQPRQFMAIAAAVGRTASSLETAVRAKQEYVSAVSASAGGTVPGVLNRARAEIGSVSGELSLLGLLSGRSASDRARLSALLTSVQSAPSATVAAVREFDLHSELALVRADYARTVPAKMIVVSTEAQSATAYQNGRAVMTTPVTTGGPELPTDHGVFHIYLKLSPFTFHSPFPVTSPYYYNPTPIQYWMPFDGAQGLHDAWWRSNFGPGSNLQPTDLGTGNTILGTHGCVNLPMSAAQFIWDWAPIGTTVVVD